MQIEPPKEKSLTRLDRLADDLRGMCLEAAHLARNSITTGRAAVVVSWQVGTKLNHAKRQWIPKGQFETWCEKELGGIEGLSIRTIYRCMAMADKLPTLADVERHNNLTKAYVAVGMLPESEETPKPIGTAEIDMFEGFVKSVLKDVTRLTSRFDGLDTSTMPADRKAEIVAAIERLETLKSKLSA